VLQVVDLCNQGKHNPSAPPHVVSNYLGLPLCSLADLQQLDDDPTDDYVLVVDKPSDVGLVGQVRQRYPVICAITWLLPEAHAGQLLQHTDLHVYVGCPSDPEQFKREVGAPLDREARARAVQLNSQLLLLSNNIDEQLQRVTALARQ
jgi:hypothetical protein